MNWHFSRSFRLIFLENLRTLSFRFYRINLTTFVLNPFRLLTQFTDNKKMRVLNPERSRHDICTTTGDLFQNPKQQAL